MFDKSDSTKKKMLNATIELMNECDNLNKLSLRRIAKRAGVTVGLINYHFQTKENLLNKSIQVLINQVISKWYDRYNQLSGDPLTKLKSALKTTATFLAKNPRLSKASILFDYTNPREDDNSIQTMKAYLTALKPIFGDSKTEQELKILVHQIISAGQAAFLRADVFKKFTGIDFFDDKQRDAFMDCLVDNIIKKT